MKCEKCGNLLVDGKCPVCTPEVEKKDPAVFDATKYGVNTSPKKKNKKTFYIILGASLLLIITSIFLYYILIYKPKEEALAKFDLECNSQIDLTSHTKNIDYKIQFTTENKINKILITTQYAFNVKGVYLSQKATLLEEEKANPNLEVFYDDKTENLSTTVNSLTINDIKPYKNEKDYIQNFLVKEGYSCNGEINSSLYIKKIFDEYAKNQPIIYNGKVYYLNDYNKLYAIKLDGTEKTEIRNSKDTTFKLHYIIDNFLYYSVYNSNKTLVSTFKMDLNNFNNRIDLQKEILTNNELLKLKNDYKNIVGNITSANRCFDIYSISKPCILNFYNNQTITHTNNYITHNKNTMYQTINSIEGLANNNKLLYFKENNNLIIYSILENKVIEELPFASNIKAYDFDKYGIIYYTENGVYRYNFYNKTLSTIDIKISQEDIDKIKFISYVNELVVICTTNKVYIFNDLEKKLFTFDNLLAFQLESDKLHLVEYSGEINSLDLTQSSFEEVKEEVE